MDYISPRWTMCIAAVAMVAVITHTVSAAYSQSSTLSVSDSMNTQNEIITSRTHAYLSCESGEMVVKINFTNPFNGMMYAHLSRDSPCRQFGNGGTYYELRIPLRGCDTWQKSPRVFVNNVTIRFHPALELEEDETKTVVCRYPPPLTPSPGEIIVAPVTLSPDSSTPANAVNISEIEILSIICVILFLSLLTLGLGTSYICLKRRNIRLVRRFKTTSSVPGSEITKLSGTTTLGNYSIFEPIRIPRAVPYSACGGSEAAILTSARTSAESGSGPSDYPPSDSSPSIESPDLMDEVDAPYVQTAVKRFYDNYGFQEHPDSILTIPKAILRKDTKRYIPPIHDETAIDAALDSDLQEVGHQNAIAALEFEDLEHSDWKPQYEAVKAMPRPESSNKLLKSDSPLYAKVKKKPRVRIVEEAKILNSGEIDASLSGKHISGTVRRQEETDVQRNHDGDSNDTKTSTAATTLFFRQGKNFKTVPPPPVLPDFKNQSKYIFRNEVTASSSPHHRPARSIPEYRLGYNVSQITPIPEEDVSLNIPQSEPSPDSIMPNVSVQGIDDVYVTTTVETELQELVTKVKRDVYEKHVKTPTRWDVIIRQRDPPPSLSQTTTNLNASASEENRSSLNTKYLEAPTNDDPVASLQKFQVAIRAIPPKDQQSSSLNQRIISAGEAPITYHLGTKASSEIFTQPEEPKNLNSEANVSEDRVPSDHQSVPHSGDLPYRNIDALLEAQARPYERRPWPDPVTADAYDSSSLLSIPESLHSEHSLGERSTSEVMEFAPTVRRNSSDIPMLERSTSEILTSAENVSRWSRVPVFENFTPEFLAAIPVLLPEQMDSRF